MLPDSSICGAIPPFHSSSQIKMPPFSMDQWFLTHLVDNACCGCWMCSVQWVCFTGGKGGLSSILHNACYWLTLHGANLLRLLCTPTTWATIYFTTGYLQIIFSRSEDSELAHWTPGVMTFWRQLPRQHEYWTLYTLYTLYGWHKLVGPHTPQ